MNPRIYQLLNQVDSNVSESDELTLSRLEAKRFYQSFQKSIGVSQSKRHLLTAACALLCCGTLLFAGPFRGEVKAAVASLHQSISSLLGLSQDTRPYEQVIGASLTYGDTTLTLNSVILGNETLVVSLTERGDFSKENMSSVLPGTVKINQTPADANSNGISTQTDSNTRETVLEYRLADIDTSKTLTIELDYTPAGDAKKSLQFAFTATGKELAADTIHVPMKESIFLSEQTTLVLDEFTSNLLSTEIHYKTEGAFNNSNVALRGTDNLGNEVLLYLASQSESGGIFKLDTAISNLVPSASTLTLTPYLVLSANAPLASATKETSQNGADIHNRVIIEDEPSGTTPDYQPLGDSFTINLK